MLRITTDDQLKIQRGLNNLSTWNKLIKIARKYEQKKYGKSYSDLSSFVYFMGCMGHSIDIESEEPKIKPNFYEGYNKKDWENVWKCVYAIYDEEFVEDFKVCLKLLKKYNSET